MYVAELDEVYKHALKREEGYIENQRYYSKLLFILFKHIAFNIECANILLYFANIGLSKCIMSQRN